MDPVRNPYSPGAGSPPPALVGRDAELEAFDIAVQRLTLGRPAKSQLLTGLRGVGKTVLLREYGQTARRHGWVHAQVEATADLEFVETSKRYADIIIPEGGFNTIAIDMIVARIEAML